MKRLYARTNKNKNFREQIAHKVQVQRALDKIDRLTPAELKRKKTKKTIKLSLHAREGDRRARVYADGHREWAPAGARVSRTPTSDRQHKWGKKASKPSVAIREYDRRARIRARIYGDDGRVPPHIRHDVHHRGSVFDGPQRDQCSRAQHQTQAEAQSSLQEPLGQVSADEHFQISSDTRNQTTLDNVMLLADTDRAWTVCNIHVQSFFHAITNPQTCRVLHIS